MSLRNSVGSIMYVLSLPLVVTGFILGLAYAPVGFGMRLGKEAMRWLIAYTSKP